MTESPWTFGDESQTVGDAAFTLVDGTTFAIGDRRGDLGGGVEGVFVADTRVCSRLQVLVDGLPCEALALSADGPSRARFVGRSADRTVIVRRTIRLVTGAVVEVELLGRTTRDDPVEVVVAVGSDLADVFAVKEGRATGASAPATATEDGVAAVLGFGAADAARGACFRASPIPEEVDAAGGAFCWRAEVSPGRAWRCRVEVVARRDGEEVALTEHLAAPPQPLGVDVTIDTDVPGLGLASRTALVDLGALVLQDPANPSERVVAAGAPWFMTLFGRDSILTAWMARLVDAELGLSTARTLARLQGTRHDPATEEEPGRIVHELRYGTGTSLALADADRYYGTVDATPLFVMLIHELWRWGAPWADVSPLLPAVDAALAWLAGPGDPDGDGFVEYLRTSEHGLVSQGWKDSWDAIAFADGSLAEPPIALAEVQGYAYAAWRAGSTLAAAAGDHRRASERNDRASALQVAFDDAFWLPDQAWYALALDRAKRPVDALASNLGHLLWTGIVPAARVKPVARALLSPELASGWGLRTLATTMARYDPLGYHTGSVWPHDTAIAIAGLRRAGCAEEAHRLAAALLAAAQAAGGRLPELFAGLGPEAIGVPVPYPASCSPQAWASASPLLVVRALLGLEPDVPNGVVRLDPALGPANHLRVGGIPLGGASVSVEVDGDAVAVRGLPAGVAVLLDR